MSIGNVNKSISLNINLNIETGEVKVEGPMHDKIFCLGLLEMANMIVRNYQPQSNIVRPAFIPPRDLGKG